ncbi:MAG: hypothetical protein POELPBGB_00776 [Bacteroidia bacterium]|nr:hypothetical protein [Bacteroidia bacterium]
MSAMTMQPVLSATIICSSSECCSDKHDTKPVKEDKGMCNPFQTCNNCSCYYAPPAAFSILIIKAEKKVYPITTAGIASGFCADCFHPPETV